MKAFKLNLSGTVNDIECSAQRLWTSAGKNYDNFGNRDYQSLTIMGNCWYRKEQNRYGAICSSPKKDSKLNKIWKDLIFLH